VDASQLDQISRAARRLIPYLFGTSLGWLLVRASRPILSMAFKNTKLTCSGKSDGGGSQVLAILGVAAFARYFGASFIHTPLSFVEHCPKHEKMEDFCSKWETIIAPFGFSETNGERFYEYGSIEDFLVDFLLFRTRGKQICLANVHYITDTHPEVYNSIGLGASSQVMDNCGTKTIYVHVRRGDVTPEGPNSFRYTSDEDVRLYIESVRQLFTGRTEVFIVTENPSLEFKEKFQDCTIISEEDPTKVLRLLARSDILVMSRSALSFVAALTSTGEVFYEPYWNRPLPSWSILPTKESLRSRSSQD
jgi:hypothetical protein